MSIYPALTEALCVLTDIHRHVRDTHLLHPRMQVGKQEVVMGNSLWIVDVDVCSVPQNLGDDFSPPTTLLPLSYCESYLQCTVGKEPWDFPLSFTEGRFTIKYDNETVQHALDIIITQTQG